MKKEKKPFYKRWWVIAIAAFLFIGFINGLMNPYDEEEHKAEAEQQEAEEKAEAEKKAKEEKEAKEKEEEEKKKEEERLKNRDTDEAIEEDNDDVVNAELSDGELTLTYEPVTMWSENSLFNVVYDAFEITHDAFEHDDVDSVVNIIKVEMVDEKGNEELKDVINYRYTRSDFEELNYDKFKEMAFGQQWRILNEADGYFIHPGIRANLKDEYTNNLK